MTSRSTSLSDDDAPLRPFRPTIPVCTFWGTKAGEWNDNGKYPVQIRPGSGYPYSGTSCFSFVTPGEFRDTGPTFK
jgi:hypothetical protein